MLHIRSVVYSASRVSRRCVTRCARITHAVAMETETPAAAQAQQGPGSPTSQIGRVPRRADEERCYHRNSAVFSVLLLSDWSSVPLCSVSHVSHVSGPVISVICALSPS